MMKKQIPAIVLGIACIALLVALINANNTVKQLHQEIAQLKSLSGSDARASEPAVTTSEQPTDEVDSNSVLKVASLVATEPPAAETEQPSSRRMMENMAKMMDNPTMNKVMEASQRGAIGALYTDLIAYLNLNDEETKYFMDLLMYRQMKQMDLGMKMMSGSLSDEEKQALQDEVKQARETVKEEMKKFLNNPDDFAEYEFYEKTMSERMMLSQMDKDLAGSDSALSDETYRELLGAMHDERENFQFTSDLSDNKNADLSPGRFSKENVQNYVNDLHKLDDAICAKAEGILTPEQYTAFVNTLKSYTDMQVSQLEMAAKMFGGGE